MIIRTVLGDIDPTALGVTLAHEHLFARPPADVTDPDLTMDDPEAAVRELRAFRAAGGSGVVEMTTVDYGRDAQALEHIARATGVHIVAASGFNKGVFANRYSAPLSEDALTSWMVGEVTRGMTPHPTAPPPKGETLRAGVIKASSSLNGPDDHERKVFAAAVRAHHATGAPIATHTEKGTWGLEQAAFFLEAEIDPGKVLIGHLDLKPDLGYLREVAATGVYLGLDQFSKTKYLSDEARVRLVVALCEAGFAEQLMLSGDMARRSYWPAYGGTPGLVHIPQTVTRMLREAGLDAASLERLTITNPRRWLAFRPP